MRLIRPPVPRTAIIDIADRLPALRWAVLAALLLAEIVGLSVVFDAGVRADDPGWAGTFVFRSPTALRAALAGSLVAASIAAWRNRDDLSAAAPTPSPFARW